MKSTAEYSLPCLALQGGTGEGSEKSKISPPLKEGSFGISSLAFSPDGKTLATWNDWKGKVVLWDVETGKERETFEVKDVHAAAFSPDGKTIAVGGRGK